MDKRTFRLLHEGANDANNGLYVALADELTGETSTDEILDNLDRAIVALNQVRNALRPTTVDADELFRQAERVGVIFMSLNGGETLR